MRYRPGIEYKHYLIINGMYVVCCMSLVRRVIVCKVFFKFKISVVLILFPLFIDVIRESFFFYFILRADLETVLYIKHTFTI